MALFQRRQKTFHEYIKNYTHPWSFDLSSRPSPCQSHLSIPHWLPECFGQNKPLNNMWVEMLNSMSDAQSYEPLCVDSNLGFKREDKTMSHALFLSFFLKKKKYLECVALLRFQAHTGQMSSGTSLGQLPHPLSVLALMVCRLTSCE